jgi:hypothetical protein
MSISEFEPLLAARQRTIELIDGLSQEDSERCPEESNKFLGEAGKWSIGEVLDHVLRVQLALGGEVEELLRLDEQEEPTVLRRTYKDYDVAPGLIPRAAMPVLEIGFDLFNRVSKSVLPYSARQRLLRTRSIPIQNPTKWLPEEGRSITELREELQSAMSYLETLLKKETKKPLEELILSHTVFGTYSVPELLGVLEVHETWHHKDIEGMRPSDSGVG